MNFAGQSWGFLHCTGQGYAVFTRDTFTWAKLTFLLYCVTFCCCEVHLPHINVSRVNTAIDTRALHTCAYQRVWKTLKQHFAPRPFSLLFYKLVLYISSETRSFVVLIRNIGSPIRFHCNRIRFSADMELIFVLHCNASHILVSMHTPQLSDLHFLLVTSTIW